jgi:hypothetical protein
MAVGSKRGGYAPLNLTPKRVPARGYGSVEHVADTLNIREVRGLGGWVGGMSLVCWPRPRA